MVLEGGKIFSHPAEIRSVKARPTVHFLPFETPDAINKSTAEFSITGSPSARFSSIFAFATRATPTPQFAEQRHTFFSKCFKSTSRWRGQSNDSENRDGSSFPGPISFARQRRLEWSSFLSQ